MLIFGCANDEQFNREREVSSYGDFYSMTKKQISNYLYKKGFGCLGSLKLSKDDLIFNAIDIYKKYGA